MHLGIEPVFAEDLICAQHCACAEGKTVKTNSHLFCPHGICSPVGKGHGEEKQYITNADVESKW